MYMTQPLHKARQEKPNSIAIIYNEREHTFLQLADGVARFAGMLKELGLEAGDRVGLMSLNSYQFIEYIYGVWWAGGVLNPVNIRWNPKEVAYSLDDCDTHILFVDDNFKEIGQQLMELSNSLQQLVYIGDGETPEGMLDYKTLIDNAQPVEDVRRSFDDLAAVMYTGGTTGMPKGVMLTHTNLSINALATVAAIPRAENSVSIQAAPLFHIGGMGLALQQMFLMQTQVILPAFNEVAVLDAIQTYLGTEMFLVPTMLKLLVEHDAFPNYDVSTLVNVLYGASPIDESLLNKAMEAFPTAEFSQLYGMTELSPVVTALTPIWHTKEKMHFNKLRSAGKPILIAEVRIVDPQGNQVPNGTVGEITARGPMVMAGYWNKPELTKAALKGGWMHTGDGGYMDDDGFLFVVDRIKDMIISGGENIYSSEVENAISLLPEVSMCAVIGLPDPKWGETVHAAIVLREGMQLSKQEIIEHCRKEISTYKCPRSIEFRDELPLSAAGKLLKYKLRKPD